MIRNRVIRKPGGYLHDHKKFGGRRTEVSVPPLKCRTAVSQTRNPVWVSVSVSYCWVFYGGTKYSVLRARTMHMISWVRALV